MSSIRDERFERFLYAVVVFKSLMFEAGGLRGLLRMTAEGLKGKVSARGGFLIIGLSLALLVGVALLKGRADSGGELDE